ncbi:MAG: NAD-dependent epimerase/dehydratase family protein [Streptosporangiaceae bacterium]
MRVFVTGASGWIGSATVDELLAAGHEITGLARSDASAAALQAEGARVRRGDLDDLASILAGAEAAEAVGVRAVSLRFAPTVHGAGDHGFIATIAAVARDKGVSGYPGDGTNRWAAVHRSGAGRLVALGLAKAPAGARLHAVAEEGVSTRDIAEAIGRAFGLPVTSIAPDDVQSHFGWIGTFFGMDLAATSTVTRELLGWEPTGPTLIEDLDAGAYSAGTPRAE